MSKQEFFHSEFHYTGNSPRGDNIVGSDGRQQLLRAIGLWKNDEGVEWEEGYGWVPTDEAVAAANDNAALEYELQGLETGEHLFYGHRIHIQHHRSRTHSSFGWQEHTTYTLV